MTAQANVLGRLRKPVLVVSCMLLCLLTLFLSIPVMCVTSNSFPSTFYVTFQGHKSSSEPYPDGTTPTLWVRFMNGTDCHTETVRLTFSMDESPEGEYTVKVMLSFEGFYNEVSLPATVSMVVFS